ncbi:MAG: hypothetical protein IBX71_09275 [Candidatus Desulforudis sp.]|nr:hypothetical protein [Desulforudis sp.]
MFVTRNNSGQASLVVVLIMAIVLLLGGAALTLASGSKQLALLREERTQAYYIADAGIEMFASVLRQHPDDPWAVTVPEEYAGGNLEVVVTEVNAVSEGTEVCLESTGSLGDAVQRIAAGMRVSRTLDFSYGVWTASPSESPSQFGNNVEVYSNVVANGALAAKNVRFVGEMLTGGLELLNSSSVSGDIWSDGDVTVKNAALTGNIYVRGALVIGNNAEVGGGVWATNDITVANNLQLGGGIESGGRVSIGNNTGLAGGVRANGPVELGGKVVIENDVMAVGDVSLGNNARVTGDVWSMGDVSLSSNARVDGDVHANGAITKKANAGVGGGEFAQQNNHFYFDVDPVVDTPAFPEADEDWYRKQATTIYQPGDQCLSLSGETLDGIHFVEGNLEISGNYMGYAVFYVTGDIAVSADLEAEDGALLLITPGDARVGANRRTDAFIFAGGGLVLGANAGLHGGLIARTVDAGSNVEIHHRPEMYHAALETHLVKVEYLYWKES